MRGRRTPVSASSWGSLVDLECPAGSAAGVLAWFSLIHLDPGRVDGVLATLRRVMAPCGQEGERRPYAVIAARPA
jgi:hypothetical protein